MPYKVPRYMKGPCDITLIQPGISEIWRVGGTSKKNVEKKTLPMRVQIGKTERNEPLPVVKEKCERAN